MDESWRRESSKVAATVVNGVVPSSTSIAQDPRIVRADTPLQEPVARAHPETALKSGSIEKSPVADDRSNTVESTAVSGSRPAQSEAGSLPVDSAETVVTLPSRDTAGKAIQGSAETLPRFQSEERTATASQATDSLSRAESARKPVALPESNPQTPVVTVTAGADSGKRADDFSGSVPTGIAVHADSRQVEASAGAGMRDREELSKPKLATAHGEMSGQRSWVETSGRSLGDFVKTAPYEGIEVTPAADGTFSAGSGSGMKRAGKQDKSAGSGLQKLPEVVEPRTVTGAAASGTGLAFRDGGSRRSASGLEDLAQPVLEHGALGGGTDVRVEGLRSGVAALSEATRSLEARVGKMEELVQREVVRFRWSGQESVSVLIRPEPGTEVTVQLRQREGQIEATLGMTRGDVARLSSHLQQLHDALADQNVRLIPSREMSSFTSSANPSQGGSTAVNTSGGTSTGFGSGSGSGFGPGSGPHSGWGSPGGNSSNGGTEWREFLGSGTGDRSPDRHRTLLRQEAEAERERQPVPPEESPRRLGRGLASRLKPDGWEFWA